MARSLPDLYGVLGVGADATDDEIRRAYRKLAREYHPDVNGDPAAEQRFKEISAAYQTLSDPARRRQYDLFGSGEAAGSFPFGDLSGFFDAFLGGGLGGFGRRRSTRPRTRARDGEDLYAPVTLSFEEAVFGAHTEVILDSRETCSRCSGTGCSPGTHPSRCSRCGGTGEIQDVSRSFFGTVMTAGPCPVCEGTGQEIASPCPECGGEGRTPKRQRVTVEVPAGVAEGMDLRVSGGGAAGRSGGATGDLFVGVSVQRHAVFERRGQDLVAALHVPFTQAALGTELDVETLDGPERVRVEPGTQSGHVVRLKGRGVPHLGRRGRGDLYLSVVVETPTSLSRKERRLLEELAEHRGEGSSGPDRRLGSLGRLSAD